MMLTWLADVARSTGYPVVEADGWQSRGHGPMTGAEGVVLHHTAGPATGDYPSLGVVRDGRPDLDGPLAHLGLARSGTIHVIAAGQCWHAGLSRWAGFTNLNSAFVGIEAESTGVATFGRYDWTSAQLDCYPRLVAALLRRMNRPADRCCAHRECALPAGRKIDPAGIDMPAFRTQVTRYLVNPDRTTEDAMPTLDEIRALIRTETAGLARRDDVGFARDQILTTLGIKDPVNAPARVPGAGHDRLTDLWDLLLSIQATQRDIQAKLGSAQVAAPPAPAGG